MTYKNLTALCFATVVALGLAACGGGGGGDAPVASMVNGNGGPLEPGPACATSATSQRCVDEKNMAMDEAKEALDAAKADENSTQKQIADAQEAYDDAKKAHDDAMSARNTYIAMQPPMYDMEALAKAIDEPDTLGGGLTVDNTDDNNVDGGMVTVDNTATPPANTYSKATWPVPTITGWAGSVWERSSSPMDSVVVYTNIEAAKSAKYSAYYAAQTPVDADGFTWVPRNAVVVGEVTAEGVMTINGTVGTGHELISAAMFPSGNGSGTTYPDNDDDANMFEVEFAGTFHGVAGMFKCTSTAACTAQNGDNGQLSSLTGGWTFTPTSMDSMIAGVRTDADYLDFGYWVNTDDSGDTVEYMVNTFFRGEDPYGTVAEVAGSANYKGGAAGLYSRRELSAGGDGDVTAAGRFTADAELMAYFGQPAAPNDNIPPNMTFSISGKIKNFMDGGTMIDAAWLVELNKIQDLNLDTVGGTFSDGTTTGGGSWNGTFYGVGDQPTGVAGQFTAEFDNGDLIGSFGATKTKK